MSAARDREALDLVASRSFAGAYLAALTLDMQTRRLTLRLYGALRGDGMTYLATLTFFGASALALTNASGAFPHSVGVADLQLSYSPSDDEGADEGAAELRGRSSWSLRWTFDGCAYEEHAATMASLVDDL